MSLAVAMGPLREGPKPPPGEKYTLTLSGLSEIVSKILKQLRHSGWMVMIVYLPFV